MNKYIVVKGDFVMGMAGITKGMILTVIGDRLCQVRPGVVESLCPVDSPMAKVTLEQCTIPWSEEAEILFGGK